MDIRIVLVFLIVIFLIKNIKINENFYAWIPTPTRYFKHINSDLRGSPLFMGYNERGTPVFYDKNSNNIGYANKEYLGPFVVGLFPFMYNYFREYFSI